MNDPGPNPASAAPLHLHDVPADSRYVATLGDDPSVAALLDYRLMERSIVLLHTEVMDSFAGQGVGSRFARSVFDDVRRRGLKVIPKCPFIVRWLERHPEEHDVLARPMNPPVPPTGGGLEPV